MALINCPECGKEISDKAASCPNCGCPVQNEIQEEHNESGKKYGAFHRILYGDNANAKEAWENSKNQRSDTYKKKTNKGLFCPKCKGHNIDLWSDSANMKEFQRTGLNLNPLHPLTPFKTKTVKKEKTSAAKVGLGILTGGTSLLVTGTKKKAHNEYYCRDCGNRWVGK